MDKTIKINLGGSLFQIDEEAFHLLRDYIQAINKRFRNIQGRIETIEDIESRIAEIFHSQKGLAGVITKENVEAMISIIGKPEDFDVTNGEVEEEQPVSYSGVKRMYRNPEDSIISGVCGGLGAYLNTDPVLFRILFIVFSAFFGIGFFVYIALWIAVPIANSEAKKREMYGKSYESARFRYRSSDENLHLTSSSTTYHSESGLSNALNEIFRAFGKVFFIFFRIILIITGATLILTGFLVILSYLLVFIFKVPGAFEGFNINPAYFPDLLNYIVNPSAVQWLLVLASIVLILPMIAFIYWGIRMILWIKVRDGIYNLAGFVLWVMSVAALSIVLFNEGISFAESASTTSQNILPRSPETLYVMSDNKMEDLKAQKIFSFDDYLFILDSLNSIHMRPKLILKVSDNNLTKVEIRKSSSSTTRFKASEKSVSLIYNYRISNDTLYLDEFFSLPQGSKWTADFVTIKLVIPEHTKLFFGNSAEKLFDKTIEIKRINDDGIDSHIDYNIEPGDLTGRYWSFSEKGLKEVADGLK